MKYWKHPWEYLQEDLQEAREKMLCKTSELANSGQGIGSIPMVFVGLRSWRSESVVKAVSGAGFKAEPTKIAIPGRKGGTWWGILPLFSEPTAQNIEILFRHLANHNWPIIVYYPA